MVEIKRYRMMKNFCAWGNSPETGGRVTAGATDTGDTFH